MSFTCMAIHDNSVATILPVRRPLGMFLVVSEAFKPHSMM